METAVKVKTKDMTMDIASLVPEAGLWQPCWRLQISSNKEEVSVPVLNYSVLLQIPKINSAPPTYFIRTLLHLEDLSPLICTMFVIFGF